MREMTEREMPERDERERSERTIREGERDIGREGRDERVMGYT